jgi:hypothetical protein
MAAARAGWHGALMLISRTSRKATKDEARQLLSVPFALTRTARAPENLRWTTVGESDGRRVWTFDLAINPHSNDSGSDYTYDNYSAAVVQLPRRIDGRVAIARRGFLRNPEESAAPEYEVGTEELQRKFRVRASCGSLADELLDARACEWLTGPGRGCHYEIVHDRVLAYGWRRWLGGKGPLRAALGLAAVL